MTVPDPLNTDALVDDTTVDEMMGEAPPVDQPGIDTTVEDLYGEGSDVAPSPAVAMGDEPDAPGGPR